MAELLQDPYVPQQQPIVPQAPIDIDASSNLELFQDEPLSDALISSRQRLQQSSKEQGGFMPHFLATAAALTGNFGPAIQLQEQKRKTAFATSVMPDIVKINELANRGKIDDAMALIETVGASAGQRVPEIIPIFQQMATRIGKKQQELQDAENLYKVLQRSVPKDHVNYDVVVALGEAVKKKTPFSQQLLTSVVNKLQPHIQNVDGQTVTTSMLTNKTTTTPFARVTQPSEFNDYIGQELAGKYKMTGTEMSNVINGIDVKLEDGREIRKGSPEALALRDDYTALQPFRARLELAKGIPIDPERAFFALMSGTPEFDVAARTFGPDKAKSIFEMQMLKTTEQEIAKQKGIMESAPFLGSEKYTPVDVRDNVDTYGTPIPGMNFNEVKATGGQVKYIDNNVLTTQIQPMIKAVKGLSYITQMFKELDDPTTWQERLGTGVNRFISEVTGVALTDKVARAKAAELFIDRALEEVERTQGVSSAVVGQLKSYIKGKFADSKTAPSIVKEVQERLMGEIKRLASGAAPPSGFMVPEGKPTGGSGTPATGRPAPPAKTPIDPSLMPGGNPYSTFTPGKGTPTPGQQAPPVTLPKGMQKIQEGYDRKRKEDREKLQLGW